MNYIFHMQHFYYLLRRNEQLSSLHIVLYLALFNAWNKHHFAVEFKIQRSAIMNSSRIGNRNTLAKKLRQLHEYVYIICKPELHIGHCAKVTMIRFSDNEAAKNQLNLFPDSSTNADTGSDTTTDTG